jgi:ATP-dependent Clp protease protease subunit
MIPIILEQTSRGERTVDIYSRLLEDRIIMLCDHINDFNANDIVAQMLLLESKDNEKDIYFYINSSGGEVAAGYAILSIMNYIKPDVSTICLSKAYSMASVLLSSGAPGKRLAFGYSSIMIHQVKSGFPYSQASDIIIQADQVKKLNEQLLGIIALNCNKPLDVVMADADRDHYFTASEALEYNLIDKII